MKYDCTGQGPQTAECAHGGTFAVVPTTGRSNQLPSSNGGVPNSGCGVVGCVAASAGGGNSSSAPAAIFAVDSGSDATRGDQMSDGYGDHASDGYACHSSDAYSAAIALLINSAAATNVIAPMSDTLRRVSWRLNIAPQIFASQTVRCYCTSNSTLIGCTSIIHSFIERSISSVARQNRMK